MSIFIELFINDATDLYNKGHYETSLTLICCAIDACAKEQYSGEKYNGKRMKNWVNDHIQIISKNGLPVQFGQGCKFQFGNIPELKSDGEGYCGIDDVIYYLIRCNLIHECKLNFSTTLESENIFHYENNTITFPHKIILGLIKAIKKDIELEYSAGLYTT